MEHLEGEVRVNGRGTVTDERRKMMRVACGRRFHHQVGIAAYALPDQPVMHRAGCEQCVHGQFLPGDVPIRQYQDEFARAHRGHGAITNVDDGIAQTDFRRIAEIDVLVAKDRLLHVQQASEFSFGKNR